MRSLPLFIHIQWAAENWQGVKEPQLGKENQPLTAEPSSALRTRIQPGEISHHDPTGFVGVTEEQDLPAQKKVLRALQPILFHSQPLLLLLLR